MLINWKGSAEINNTSMDELNIYLEKYPASEMEVIRICIDCGLEEIKKFSLSGDRCKNCNLKHLRLINLGENNPMFEKPGHVLTREELNHLRLINLGLRHSKESIEKMSGKNCHFWKGGKKEIKCNNCGKDIFRFPSEINLHNFCDYKCEFEYIGGRIDTNIEVLMQDALSEAGYKFETQVHILNYYPDILLTDYNIIIECDGDYWHCNPDIYPEPINDIQIEALKYDPIKNKKLTMKGYVVLRFWENDIKNNIMKCILKIEETLEERIQT